MDVRLGIIVASTRPKRRSEGFARWIQGVIAAQPGLEIELLDLREHRLPSYDYEGGPSANELSYPDATAREWSAKIHALDAYVIVTPEYNHSFPGQLKNALDHVHTGWFYKPVGFVSYGGVAGGARAVEQLRNVAVELRMVPVRGEVNIRLIGLATDEHGAPTDPLYTRQATAMIDQLLWWARTAKAGRERQPPP